MTKKNNRLPRDPLDELIKNTTKPEKVENVQKPNLFRKAEQPEKVDKLNFLVARTFKIKKIWDDALDRILYWERKQKQVVL